ncbi:3-oxoacyl-ACP reductase family protein [uncultured Hymenobacter sp.]|uniref:3-oxoacyl-ACP reductase family protein n=1 Tax=uncultured Hymenobacter sp. TaxID=170016 RepID=UPI0035C985D5
MSRFTNKVALVTGGSRGIGAAIVRRLTQEGAAVAFTYVSSTAKAEALATELTQQGLRVLALQADSADSGAVTAAVEQVAATFGRVDILVNNAGISSNKPFEEYTLTEFRQLLAVHVEAPFVAAQAALPHMVAGGRIITIGSNLAERVPTANATLYATTKAALLGFTKGLARDVGARRITVNLIQPGPIDTDMNPADSPYSDWLRAQMAIPEFGQGADIASLTAWVASEEGRFVTGSILTIDGGMNS